MAIPSWKITPALIAGNTVVFKPASFTPRMAVRFVEVLEEAGIPAGVVNLVIGGGADVGNAVVEHPDVDLISFTGSTETGIVVAERAARLNKRCSLEMGGKNAIVVMDDADIELATDGILWSAFGTSGQRCTAGSRVIVHRDVQRQLVDRLVDRAGGMRLGNGLDETVQIGPVVSQGQLDTVHGYVNVGQQEGARLAVGGKVATSGELASGFFHEPTIFDNVRADMRVAQEEIFGPVTSVVPVGSLEEAIDVVNGVKYGLSASIFTQDINKRVSSDAGHLHRHPLCQCRHHRRRDSLAIWWHKSDRQRSPRSGHRHPRLLYRVAEHLRRLQRPAAAGAD